MSHMNVRAGTGDLPEHARCEFHAACKSSRKAWKTLQGAQYGAPDDQTVVPTVTQLMTNGAWYRQIFKESCQAHKTALELLLWHPNRCTILCICCGTLCS